MIDIHTHILYGVDDGVKTIEESIAILRKMSENGVTDVYLTPHYIEDSSYTSNVKQNQVRFNNIKKELNNNNIKINVYLANEIYINDNILKLLKNNEIQPLSNKNLLIELPMNGEYNNYMDVFLELKEAGYKVTLAHPERYLYFHKHFDELVDMHNRGILFQINLESILGKYGRNVKKSTKKLLKRKIVDSIGSDIHHDKKDYSYIEKSTKKFRKYLNDNELKNIKLI